MTTAWENEARLLREPGQDDYVELVGVYHAFLRFAEHFPACNVHLLNSAIVKFKQLTPKFGVNITFAVSSIDLL